VRVRFRFLLPLLCGILLYAVDPVLEFPTGTRILFQGDSITDGGRGRTADPNHIFGQSYVFLIAAKYGALEPEHNLVFLNRGVSGNKVSDLVLRWQKDTLDLKPDLLSILIGINDTSHGVPVEDFEKQYDKLLADTLAVNPRLRIVLGEPFTLPVGKYKQNWNQWRYQVQLRQRVVAKLAAKYHTALVRYQQVFDKACQRAPAEYWIWDGVHPTYAGHQLMADEWVRTVRAFWR
jgi:lysophospholipase L1-like esterase